MTERLKRRHTGRPFQIENPHLQRNIRLVAAQTKQTNVPDYLQSHRIASPILPPLYVVVSRRNICMHQWAHSFIHCSCPRSRHSCVPIDRLLPSEIFSFLGAFRFASAPMPPLPCLDLIWDMVVCAVAVLSDPPFVLLYCLFFSIVCTAIRAVLCGQRREQAGKFLPPVQDLSCQRTAQRIPGRKTNGRQNQRRQRKFLVVVEAMIKDW